MRSISCLQRHLTLAATVAAIGILITPYQAHAQDITFKGKRLSVIIGATPGGGTDGTTRLLGRYLEKQLPGKPRMHYRNMPAGGGVKATNYFNTRAKRDGTFWMGGGNAYIDAQMLRLKVVEYDPRTFHFIGGVARGGSVMNLRRSQLPNLTDRSLKPIVIGTGDGNGTWEEMMCWGAEFLNWNIRFVIGYPGTPSLMLASRRGEIDAFGTSSLRMLDSLRKAGQHKEIVQIGETRNGKVGPRGYASGVPTIASLLEGKLTGIARETFSFWSDSNQIDKWYALPPKTPASIVAVFRAAFTRAVKDPDFIKYGKAQFSPDFRPQTADEMTRLVQTTSYPSAAMTSYTHKLKVKYGLPGRPLTDEELTRLTAKLVKMDKVTAGIAKVKRGGRILEFKAGSENHSARVSGSRTKVSIAGKKAMRSAIKAGMTCEITYAGNAGEASKVVCQ